MTDNRLKKKEILSKIAHGLYLNSRAPISKLAKKIGVSHQTVLKYITELEQDYGLKYVLDVNTVLLGFSEARIITVKFDQVPEINLLKRVLDKDPFVQNAYLASGGFDLVLHVIGLNYEAYGYWDYKFRMGFSRFKPRVKVSTLDNIVEGFMPIKSELIEKSVKISNTEKKILSILLKNSRIRLKELSRKTGLSQMKVIYAINKLRKIGIIRQFTTCIQNQDKPILLFYTATLIPNEHHHPTLLLGFLNKIIGEEETDQISVDYSVVADISGSFDIAYFCNFKDWAALNERGPNFLKKIWESEYPITEQCILTELITGSWPFNTNGYTKWRAELEGEKKNPIKFEIYK